ncbi:M61 family metallopeptidase [Leeuwenhoekiella sp. A16]|uniref:M61 family metallopeptidase n=1 Tax=Leeuwenhoekiella sp. A16 TaxID=3141462 RepID=UPI003A80EDFD
MRLLLALLLLSFTLQAQTNTYDISFKNAVHHEAVVKATFPNIKTKTVKLQMSRSSPGRYALHEFAKNVYGVKITNSKGEELEYTRPDPYSWEISGHDGTVNVEYTLFGNRGDGTYSQIDETHAHLNMPATFMYVDDIQYRPIEVTFQPREDLNWKVATQLKELKGNTFYAPNLYYFMDSPTEISDYDLREFDLDGKHIRFVLHHLGTEAEVDTYFEKVKKIVEQEKAVYGELPDYDYGEYAFLACYMPNASGDGMEHRNSTILTDTEGLAEGGMENNIGTVSHEYFHSWNVERIRPADLEPFKFDKANMSDALWFAEGFTSYYTNLILCRAGIITPEKYISGLTGTFNYVWNSPARDYFNPIEMSRQAPFVDAATSVDPVNRENTFISYYSYGSVLGLALDLILREKGLNLDDFMQKMWKTYGKPEVAYQVSDIEETLGDYAGEAFAKAFFDKYIYKSEMPDYKELLQQVGVVLSQDDSKAYLGASLKETEDGLLISRNTAKGSPAYTAGLDSGDLITTLNGSPVTSLDAFNSTIENSKPGDKLSIGFKSYQKDEKTEVKLSKDPAYSFSIDENAGKNQLKERENWLKTK